MQTVEWRAGAEAEQRAINQQRSRRSFLYSAAGAFGASWLTLHWPEIAKAAEHAHDAAQVPATATLSFLSAAEAADVAAVAAQIIPTDETPGAREAGVVFFIDRALASFLAYKASQFRTECAQFRSDCVGRFPQAGSFAALSDEQQIEYLREVEQTPFFSSMHTLTVLGMFASPSYGGNRDLAGWKLLGFEDQHVFEPPFGYYDRDYPGFVVQPK